MEMTERIKICSTCKNHKMDINRGIVCNLTDQKPEFELTCESYLENQESETTLNDNMEANENIEGKEILKGANWFRTIASLSLINVVVSFFDIAFIFGLGSTQLLQIAITNKMLDPVLGVIGIFVLPAFFFWTWWLTAVKGYKLAYNIGWSIYLVDFVLLIYLYIQNDEASSLIVDLVLHVVALLVFFKIFDINSSEYKSNKFKWNAYKISYILAAIVAVIIAVYSAICITGEQTPEKASISSIIKSLNKELPKEIEENVILQKIEENHNTVEYVYQLNNTLLSNIDSDYLTEYANVHKHEILYTLGANSSLDEFIINCLEEGHDFVFCFNDAIGKKMYEVVVTPKEYKSIKTKGTYKCPINEISKLISQYTTNLPIEYIGGLILNNIYLTSDNSTIVYDITLPQMTPEELKTVTPSYLDEYFKANLDGISDSMMRLAAVNQMTICFDICTYSGVKYTKVNITPNFYNSIAD